MDVTHGGKRMRLRDSSMTEERCSPEEAYMCLNHSKWSTDFVERIVKTVVLMSQVGQEPMHII